MIENFEKCSEYARNLFKKEKKFIEIEKECIEDKIPIIHLEALSLLLFIIKMKNIKKVLEIGTAYGYSGAYISKYANLTTIEIDEKRFEIAKRNFESINANVKMHLADANEILPKLNEKYDLIFIDASKGHYAEFLENSYNLLNDSGIIFIDNILFKGYVCSENYPKRYKTIVNRMKKFIEDINENYEFTLLPFADGIGLIFKKG